MIHLHYKDVKIGKSYNLAYLVPVLYEYVSEDDESTGSKSVINNISPTISEAEVKLLAAILIYSKMIFLGDHTPIKKLHCKMLIFQKLLKRN